MKLVSFDIQADFGFFRKPETNNTINLSYNLIHKPALLGILGAILGLEGYREKGAFPLYYSVLKNLMLGIEPLNHDKGNYLKTAIKYTNTIGYANKGSNFLTEELTLVGPAFRIYLYLDIDNSDHAQLYEKISNGESIFVPYFGKNEYSAWWEKSSFKEYQYSQKEVKEQEAISIRSIFLKEIKVRENIQPPFPDFTKPINFAESPFIYFERLPHSFNEKLFQYELIEFAYSTYQIRNAHSLSNLFYLEDLDAYVQLF